MKKILSILLAVMMIASLATLAVSADVYDEVEIEGLPEGVHGFDIEGDDSFGELFEVTKKYFVASMTFPLLEKQGIAKDNGCIGLTIGGESYECFYVAHDVVYSDEDTRGPGFSPDDMRAQLRVGAWWETSAFGAMQKNYLDGEEDAIEGGNYVGNDITISVEAHIDVDETDDSWTITIDAAYINGVRILLNGGLDSVTAYNFETNPYVGYGCKLTGTKAQIKFAQSMKEIKASVLTEEGGMPDDTGMTDLLGNVIGGGNGGYERPTETTTMLPTTTKRPTTTKAPSIVVPPSSTTTTLPTTTKRPTTTKAPVSSETPSTSTIPSIPIETPVFTDVTTTDDAPTTTKKKLNDRDDDDDDDSYIHINNSDGSDRKVVIAVVIIGAFVLCALVVIVLTAIKKKKK